MLERMDSEPAFMNFIEMLFEQRCVVGWRLKGIAGNYWQKIWLIGGGFGRFFFFVFACFWVQSVFIGLENFLFFFCMRCTYTL